MIVLFFPGKKCIAHCKDPTWTFATALSTLPINGVFLVFFAETRSTFHILTIEAIYQHWFSICRSSKFKSFNSFRIYNFEWICNFQKIRIFITFSFHHTHHITIKSGATKRVEKLPQVLLSTSNYIFRL